MTAAMMNDVFESPLKARTATHSARPVRLTRRGRRVVMSLIAVAVVSTVAAVVFVVSSFMGGSVAASTNHSHVQTTAVVVKSGQTLWQIAKQVNPSGDPRDTLEQISDLNGLDASATVHAGQVLQVPLVA
jgi:nucleoid-associated protein YgaU